MTHVILEGSDRVALPGARAVGRANPHAEIEVTLKLRRRAPLADVPTRPDKVLSRAELADQYGASPQDIAAVTTAFAPFGLTVASADAATRTVVLRGPVDGMERAFEVKLFDYEHPQGHYRGRIGPLHVPAAMKDIVAGVFGLDDRRTAQRRRPPRDRARIHAPLAKHIPPSWYKPQELAQHYHFPDSDGAGETVGILEFGGGYFESDFKIFCKLCAIDNVPPVQTVSVDGAPTAHDDDAAGEVMLDVEVVAGACPKTNIVVYFAHNTTQGWIRAFDAAVHDTTHKPGVISLSWGGPESPQVWTKQLVKQVTETLLDAAHLGITVCVAAGDDGSGDGIKDGHAYVDFPSSSQYVLAVGGTTIPHKGTAQPDIVWKEGDGIRDDGGGSTGGGVSAIIKRPSWQEGLKIASVNPHGIVGRIVPDIAVNADWTASPYLLVVDGQAEPNGGTSAAAPLLAALITRINSRRRKAGRQSVGFLAPLLYAKAPGSSDPVGKVACTDVISGDNVTAHVGGYKAAAGFDAASGWGTPNGKKLDEVLDKLVP